MHGGGGGGHLNFKFITSCYADTLAALVAYQNNALPVQNESTCRFIALSLLTLLIASNVDCDPWGETAAHQIWQWPTHRPLFLSQYQYHKAN